MIIDPLGIAFGLIRHIIWNKRILFIRSMCHDEDLSDRQLTAAHNIILKAGILYKLLMDFRCVFYLIEVVVNLRFSKNVSGTVIIIITEGCLADDWRSKFQMASSFPFLKML